jgi:cytochrome c1
MSDQAPLSKQIKTFVLAQGTAGGAQDETIGKAPFDGTVTAVTIVPEAALTADNTNNRTFRLVNKGQAGAGTTVVASYQSNVAGGSLVAFDEKALTLSGTPANLTVAQDDVLAADEVVAGTGVAHSGYTIQVEFARS